MKLPIRLVIVLVLAGCLLAPWRASRIVAVLDVLLLLPAWALVARARISLVPSLGLAASTSPVLFGAIMMAAMLAGVQPHGAAWIAVAVFAVTFVVGGGGRVASNDTEIRIARALFAVTIFAAALALALPLTNEWWRVREDSWFHAAVLQRIVHHGVPPVDPYFSPLRLQYMYFYHTILAGVSSLTTLGPFHSMILVNAAALLGCVFGFGYLSSFFSRKVWPRVLGASFVLFGMNGLFYLFYPVRLARAFFGETSGTAMLAHFFPWSPSGHATATQLLSIENNQFLFLDKFMMGTALSLTLGLVCVILGLLISARRGHWTRGHTVLFVIALAGTLYLHAIIGAVVLAATLILLALLMMVRSHTGDGAPSYPALTALALLAAAIAAPYLLAVMPRGGGGQSLRFAVQPGHMLGLLSDILPAVILSIPFLRWVGKNDEWRKLNHRDENTLTPDDETPAPPGGILMGRLFGELSLSGAGIIAMWVLIVLAMALVVDLPTNNETKFSFLLFLPLAAFATGGINRMWNTRRGRVTAVILLAASTLPLHAIYFHHAVRDANTFEVTGDERATYRFIERRTPLDALFLDADDIVRVPVLAARDLYWGNETYAFNWGYPTSEMRLRREIRDAVYGESALSTEHIDILRSQARPVYAICRGAQFDSFALFQRMNDDPFYTGRFFAGEFAVFEMDLVAAADSALGNAP